MMCCTLMHAWSFRLIYNVLLDYFTFKVKYILKSGSSWVYHSMGCKDGGRTHLSLSLPFCFIYFYCLLILLTVSQISIFFLGENNKTSAVIDQCYFVRSCHPLSTTDGFLLRYEHMKILSKCFFVLVLLAQAALLPSPATIMAPC